MNAFAEKFVTDGHTHRRNQSFEHPFKCLGFRHLSNGSDITGSSRRSVKSKTVCMGIHFHKSLVFTGVLGWKLATNLSSWAPRSTIITPTTAHHLKDPHCVFQLVRTKISIHSYYIILLILPFTYGNTHIVSYRGVSESVVGLKKPPSLKEHWRR